MISDLIILSQSGDENATLSLVNKFKPLLNKYAYKINYGDAYEELLLEFLILIKSIQLHSISNNSEGALVTYIQKSIYNSFVKQSIKIKQLRSVSLYSELSEGEMYYVESITAHSNDYDLDIDLQSINHILTNQELIIIKMIYFLGYSPLEISIFYGISRQAANQTKKRALKKLKIFFSDKQVK